MNIANFQPTLLFPFRDEFARKQFLFAALVTLAGMIVPIIPMIILMGYTAKIMRQIINEDKEPTMLEWQGSDWGDLLREGIRLFGVRILFMLPAFLFFGCGAVSFMTSPILFASSSNGDSNPLAPFGGLTLAMGIGLFLLGMLLSLPVGIIMGAAESHAVSKENFQAALQFREWWPIFRAGLGYFLGAYVFTLIASFVLSLVVQIAMVTLILACIVPFLMLGYSTYILLVMSALFAQAYASGRKALQAQVLQAV